MIVIWGLDVVISQLITVTIKVAEPAANHDEVRSIFLIDQGHKAVTPHGQDVESRHHTTSPEHQPTPHTHPPPARMATVDAAARSRAPRSPHKPWRGGTRVRRGRGGATAPVLVGWPRSGSLYSGGIGVATACRSLETSYVNLSPFVSPDDE